MPRRPFVFCFLNMLLGCSVFFAEFVSYKQPLSIGKAGSTTQISIVLREPTNIGFYLLFLDIPQMIHAGNYGLILGRVGNPHPAATDGEGLRIPLHIIVKDENDVRLVDDVFERQTTETGDRQTTTRIITEKRLPKGSYSVIVTVLQEQAALQATRVMFVVETARQK